MLVTSPVGDVLRATRAEVATKYPEFGELRKARLPPGTAEVWVIAERQSRREERRDIFGPRSLVRTLEMAFRRAGRRSASERPIEVRYQPCGSCCPA